MSEGIKNMNHNKCGYVFDTEKIAACIGKAVLSAIKKGCGGITAQPFVKHIFWRSKSENDVFSLEQSPRCMWISSSVTDINCKSNITVNGFVTVKSDSAGRVRIRPVLYQPDGGDADFSKRSRLTDFDVESDINRGIGVIPFSSVISAEGDCGGGKATKLGFVIMASGAGDITEFSYTINGIPSESERGVEVLNVQGLVSDYRDESETPLFLIKYPPDKEAEQEDYYE